MAGAACVSPLMSLPSTRLLLLSSSPVGCTLFPSKSRYHRYYYYGARTYGNPRPTIRHGKLNNNGSRGERVQEEEIEDDETFFQLMGEEIEDNNDGDDTESSLDLLFRFLYSMFKMLSKRARKASRAVLPDVISPQLLSFSVDGVLLLASLSILKALLEVVCTLGGTIFVVILMLRVIWAAVSYFQSSVNFNQSGPSYNRTQPIT